MALNLRAMGLFIIISCVIAHEGVDPQATIASRGSVQGTVFLDGPLQPSYVKEARVVLQSESMISSTITDGQGKFSFPNIAPGKYTVQATYFGLEGEQNVTVNAGGIMQIELPLKLAPAKTPVGSW